MMSFLNYSNVQSLYYQRGGSPQDGYSTLRKTVVYPFGIPFYSFCLFNLYLFIAQNDTNTESVHDQVSLSFSSSCFVQIRFFGVCMTIPCQALYNYRSRQFTRLHGVVAIVIVIAMQMSSLNREYGWCGKIVSNTGETLY